MKETKDNYFINVKEFKDMKPSDCKGMKRLEGESYEEYKIRRKIEQKFLKFYKRGRRIL